jgi:hypothetical protein
MTTVVTGEILERKSQYLNGDRTWNNEIYPTTAT